MGYYNLSIAYYRTNKNKKALKLCKKAMAINPDIADVKILLERIKKELK